MEDLFALKRADAAAHAPSCVARRLREIEHTEEIFREEAAREQALCVRDLAVGGADALAAGVAPGPEVGRALRSLLESVIEGDLPNERDSLMEALTAFAARRPSRA